MASQIVPHQPLGQQQYITTQPLPSVAPPVQQPTQQLVTPHQQFAAPPVQQPMQQLVTPHQQFMAPQVQQPMQQLVTPHQQFAAPPKGHPVQQMLRGERHLFSTSDDNVMMKQIQATHAPDGRIVEVKPLLSVVEDILQRAAPALDSLLKPSSQAHMEALEVKTHQDEFIGMLEALAYTIHKISCEISCKCSGGGDAHATTVSLFNTLSSYTWDAKVVLALAAFAVNYGQFWLVAQLYPNNHLAKSIALLKQLPEILERNESLRPRFEALNTLIKAMMDVTRCIVEFTELPAEYINQESPVMMNAWAHVPTAVYWTIRSIVACSSQIIGLIGLGHEYITSTTEAWELSSLAHKVDNIHGHLRKQLTLCYQHIDEKRHIEAYHNLVRLFETIHIDNMKVLRALIYAHDDILPLYYGTTKKRVNLEVLRRRNVLLLISDIGIPHEELSILDQMYRESRHQPNRPESFYEVVWLPVVDRMTPWTEEKQTRFEEVKNMMPWYSVHDPKMIEPWVIKYIKEVWHFAQKPILVVLDPQGRVANQNALHMMWIWGSLAFPFTSQREDALWREESWRMELLVDGIDQNLLNWIDEKRLICLYGGEDIDWIRKFTKAARSISQDLNLPIELIYVGKSNPKERVRRNNAIITVDKLSHIWPDLTSIWFFWVRLESMWYSKMQHGKTVESDPIMQEIMTMLTFDGSDQGWAVFSKGSSEMAKAKGETILMSLTQINEWKDHVEPKGFVPALNEYLHQIHTPHHCNRLILPGTSGNISEMVVCAECGRSMEKYIMYRCCND